MNEIINLAAAIASIILAILSMLISIWFFVLSKKSEKETSISLTKIETQAESLQKLNSKWMDKLTNFVTTDKPNPAEAHFSELIKIVASIPVTLSNNMPSNIQEDGTDSNEENIKNLLTLYIGLYFYIGQTNYWTQGFLPEISEFQQNDPFHIAVKRIIDTSFTDFSSVENVLSKFDNSLIESDPLYGLFKETVETIKQNVKSVSEIFINRNSK